MMPILKKGSEWIGIVGVILWALWFIGQPAAQSFIEQSVDEKISEIAEALEEAEAGVTAKVEKLDDRLNEQELSAARQDADLDTIKALQTESRADVKAILQSLRGLRQDLQ